MNKDRAGNYKSIYRTLGASNHTEQERAELDYYATHPEAVKALLRVETFSHFVWEPACGGGHIAEVLKDAGYDVLCSDIVNRGYEGTEVADFFKVKKANIRDIITNPPYSKARQFVEKALEMSSGFVKIAMLLKLTFLEGKARKTLFEAYPPKTIYVFSSRVKCAKNGDFGSIGRSAVCYAWFIWEKGFKGNPQIKWI